MDKETLKKSVTLNLRCVAQSCKGGVPLSSLQSDYKALIGTAIPFIELGYKSLECFLKSMPDVVCLKKNKGGQCVVEGVADASTAHIASLISRQKATKATKKSNSKKPSLPIRKYPRHESWKSSPTNSGGTCKQNSKTCDINPANPKVPMPKPVNSGNISSTSNKIGSACFNQNNVIYGQSDTKAHPLGAEPSNSGQLYSSPFTDTKTFIRPPVPSSSSQKRAEILENDASYISNTSIASKDIVPLSIISDTLSKQQPKRRRKAKQEVLSNSSESPLSKSQRRNRRKKIRKAEKLHETTQMCLEMLKVLPNGTAPNFVCKPPLNLFPNIRYSILNAKFSSLLMINFLLFGDDSYMETLKRGILAFDGYSFCKGSEQWKQKELLLSMLSEDTLRECLKLLCIECISDNKKELVTKLLEFLVSPGNALSNRVKKKRTEKVIKKEGDVDNTSVSFSFFDINALETLKKLQEYVCNQEFKTLSDVSVKCASASKLSNSSESVHVCQSEKVNVKPNTVKVVESKESNQSAQIFSKKSTGVESKQFQKLQSVFSLNPNTKVLETSAEMPTGAAGNIGCISKSYHNPSNALQKIIKKKKKKKEYAANKSETNI